LLGTTGLHNAYDSTLDFCTSEGGQGIYPTLKDFTYGEEVEFFHVGQPNLQFRYSYELNSM